MNRSVYAALCDKFHLTPEQIANLTDFQIRHLYFHPRKKDGSLDIKESVPMAPRADTPKSRREEYMESLNLLENWRVSGLIDHANYTLSMQQLKDKYQDLWA